MSTPATPPAVQDGDSVWMRTCIQHTDAQRNAANQCPVCILRERDTLASQLAQAQSELNNLRAIHSGDAPDEIDQLNQQLAQAQEELQEQRSLLAAYTAAREECERLRGSCKTYKRWLLEECDTTNKLRAEKEELAKMLTDTFAIIDAHDMDTFDCDRSGVTHCDCLSSHRHRCESALAKHQQA